MENVAWGRIIAAGWPVLSVLLIGSIVTVAVIWERWKVFSRIKSSSANFVEALRAQDPHKIATWSEKSDQPLALITKAIFKAASRSREDMERALERCIQGLVQNLETNVSLLGTIASVAPFVGLLGTVIGIIRSFRAVSMTSSGGASLVALGIAEALVGTAGGLIVAIPALLGYNYFVNRLRRLTQEWELIGEDIIDLALKRG